ncbi:MAG: hypothetical protein AB7O73_08050 [Bacteroidia bacterium]
MKVRNIILIAFLFIALSCSEKSGRETNVENNQIPKSESKLICSLIINEVNLNNKLSLKFYGATKEFEMETNLGYYDTSNNSLSSFKTTLLQTVLNAPNKLVYYDLEGENLSNYHTKSYIHKCDSIVEYDKDGKIENVIFTCDTASNYRNLYKLLMYETWQIDKNNANIKKEVLGYSLCTMTDDESKNSDPLNEKIIIHVFENEEKYQYFKKHVSISTLRKKI